MPASGGCPVLYCDFWLCCCGCAEPEYPPPPPPHTEVITVVQAPVQLPPYYVVPSTQCTAPPPPPPPPLRHDRYLLPPRAPIIPPPPPPVPPMHPSTPPPSKVLPLHDRDHDHDPSPVSRQKIIPCRLPPSNTADDDEQAMTSRPGPKVPSPWSGNQTFQFQISLTANQQQQPLPPKVPSSSDMYGNGAPPAAVLPTHAPSPAPSVSSKVHDHDPPQAVLWPDLRFQPSNTYQNLPSKKQHGIPVPAMVPAHGSSPPSSYKVEDSVAAQSKQGEELVLSRVPSGKVRRHAPQSSRTTMTCWPSSTI